MRTPRERGEGGRGGGGKEGRGRGEVPLGRRRHHPLGSVSMGYQSPPGSSQVAVGETRLLQSHTCTTGHSNKSSCAKENRPQALERASIREDPDLLSHVPECRVTHGIGRTCGQEEFEREPKYTIDRLQEVQTTLNLLGDLKEKGGRGGGWEAGKGG